MTTLVIVESPGKTRKLSALLGPGYRVVASVGHVRDLPKSDLGFEPPHFRINYVPTERGHDILKRLRHDVAQADHVLLATDPDREGEAIAWHLADALNLRQPQRITFSAITKDKVLAAVAQPRQLDMPLVHAQEARRVLDRMIGYRISPVLSRRNGQTLSAGRVQSPAVRLVVDLERQIKAFVSTEHYGAELTFGDGDAAWKARWDVRPWLSAGTAYQTNQTLADRAAAVTTVRVLDCADTQKSRAPNAPFTTSTLQQAASQRLKLRPKQTMALAQKLYEQGAITYHRTDAPNIDAEGALDIAAYAKAQNLPLAPTPRTWKAKDGAQEGHEAIRPTHCQDLIAGETAEERALYQLIWQRALASQLADARYAVRTVNLEGQEGGDTFLYRATGRTLLFAGWLTVYADHPDDDRGSDKGTPNASEPGDLENPNEANPVPVLAIHDAATVRSGKTLVQATKPPHRFTEATLVKELEKQGIGRPSTYAAILDNITSREYILADRKGYLSPSAIGEVVRDSLVGNFRFCEIAYTRELETGLDEIAAGKGNHLGLIRNAWDGLDTEITALATVPINSGPPAHPCPTCNAAMTRRKGQSGFFWACTAYPECRTTLPDERGVPGQRKAPPPPSGISCPKCGKDLARRTGTSKPRKRGDKPRPYDFYSCTGYPVCNASFETAADGKPKMA